MRSKDKIAIGMVNNGTIDSMLAQDLIHIAIDPSQRFHNLIQVGNIGLTTRSRNLVVKTFLETTQAAWLLMIDSDERLSLEAFKKLVNSADEKDRPIVSGLVFAAFFDENDGLRPVPTIYRMDPEKGLEAIDAYPEDQLIEVDAVGTGCLLIHRSVLLEMQKQATPNQGKDWAWFVEGAINGTYFGEDLLFSKRLKSMGFPIYAHTGAVLPHHKQFWLTDRHHTPFRDWSVKQAEASISSEPLTDEIDAQSTNKEQ
jgi:GT2 family glycosyltransferase